MKPVLGCQILGLSLLGGLLGTPILKLSLLEGLLGVPKIWNVKALSTSEKKFGVLGIQDSLALGFLRANKFPFDIRNFKHELLIV